MTSVLTKASTEPVSKRKLSADYNTYMSGVDHCYKSLNRKTTKWWKRLFFCLLDMSVVNAVILYTTVFPEKGHERQCHKKIQYEISPSTCAAIVGQLCRSSVG